MYLKLLQLLNNKIKATYLSKLASTISFLVTCFHTSVSNLIGSYLVVANKSTRNRSPGYPHEGHEELPRYRPARFNYAANLTLRDEAVHVRSLFSQNRKLVRVAFEDLNEIKIPVYNY